MGRLYYWLVCDGVSVMMVIFMMILIVGVKMRIVMKMMVIVGDDKEYWLMGDGVYIMMMTVVKI